MADDLHAAFDAEPDLHAAFDAEPEAPRTPPQSRLVSPKEAAADPGAGYSATLGALDWLPGGKQAAAFLTALRSRAQGGPDLGETYHQALNEYEREDRAAKAHQSLAHMAGAAPALLGTAYALPGGAAAQGGLYGLLGSGADDALAQGNYGEAAARAAGGTSLGALLGRGAEAAAPWAAGKLGEGVDALGGKVNRLAGWLKINSIHPTPTLGEAMAELPGGKPEVGLELLRRGVGGFTKEGTAKQAGAAATEAAKAIDAVAAAHDAAGGPLVDIRPALTKGLDEAQRLQSQSFASAKSAGKALENVVYDYASKHPGGQVPASVALAIKRELQGEAYGASGQLAKSGDQLAGHYSKGVASVAKTLDDSMDSTLGPAFGEANLTFRRLLGAANAADRQAGRASANHLLGLIPSVIGAGEMAAGHGAKDASLTALAMALANKYGSQAGARLLYSPVGGGLNLAGVALRGLPGALAGNAATEMVAPRAGSLADLIVPRPALAQGSP